MPEWRRKRERRQGVKHESRRVRMREWSRGRNALWRIPIVLWMTLVAVQYTFGLPDFSTANQVFTMIHMASHGLFGTGGGTLHALAGPVLPFIAFLIIFRLAEWKGDYFAKSAALALLAVNAIWFAHYTALPDSNWPYTPLEIRSAEACECDLAYSTFAANGVGPTALVSVRVLGIFAVLCLLYDLVIQLSWMLRLKENRRRDRRRPEPIPIDDGEL